MPVAIWVRRRCYREEEVTTVPEAVYAQLAEALDRPPNGFPRTPSGVEITILEKIFSPEEASLAVRLSGEYEAVETIAGRLGLPAEEARRPLFEMARRGLAWFEKRAGAHCFRLAPFIVGFYEAQVGSMDHQLAHLVEDYLAGGGAAGIMGPEPALHRVMPVKS
jgi:hypothetical protein